MIDTSGGGTVMLSDASLSDADGCPGSSSANLSFQGGISQCVPAKADIVYYLSYRYTQSVGGALSCIVRLYSELNCGGAAPLIAYSVDSAPTPQNLWTLAAKSLTSPAGTKSASVSCQPVVGGSSTSYVDQISLNTTGTAF